MILNLDNDAYQMVINSEMFVDKSLMITETNKLLNSENRFASVTRSRRFGKTVSANMLIAYYSRGCDAREMFSNTKLAQVDGWDKYLNQFDTFYIDMQGIFCESQLYNHSQGTSYTPYQWIDRDVTRDMHRLYPDSGFDGSTFADAIKFIFEKFGRKSIVILDEWDYVFREQSDPKVVKEYWNFLNNLFKNGQLSRYIALGYMTGIMPIKRIGTQSFLNCFRDYSMITPRELAPYIGFTRQEVEELCKKYDFDINELVRWYDGYLFDGYEVFNTLSVVEALRSRRCDLYWTATSSFGLVKSFVMLNVDGLHDALLRLISGERLTVNVNKFDNDPGSINTRDNVLTMLIHLGYLAYDYDEEVCYVPNNEIRIILNNAISDSDWSELTSIVNKSETLTEAIKQRDADTVAALIDEAHEDYTSILKYNDENSLACAMTMALISAQRLYSFFRELPAGKGYCDLLMYPRKKRLHPILVELKFNKDAKTAIDQIKEKRYLKSLKGYSGPVTIVAVNYDKETKKHTCLFEDIEI